MCGRTGLSPPADQPRHERRLHEVPFAVEDRLIDLSSVPDAATADFSREPPGSWLLHHVPWTEAEHTISAVVADDRERRPVRRNSVLVGPDGGVPMILKLRRA